MSKKCCGIIYNENEKFCTMCGKSLADVPDVDVENTSKSESEENSVKEDEKSESLDMDKIEQQLEDIKASLGDITIESSDADEETSKEVVGDSKKSEKEIEAKAKDNHIDDKENDEDDDDDDDDDDGLASPVQRLFGTLIIMLMLASIIFVGLGIYFIKLEPFYRNHNINEPVIYDEMATDTDVNNVTSRPPLVMATLGVATQGDAQEVATAQDAQVEETDVETDTETQEDME